jgi:DNA-binding MarR family transcriptional regulator
MTKRIAAKSIKPDYEKRIIRALRQLTQELDAHSRHLLTGYDITMPQILCLDELSEKGAMTVSVLANAIHLSPSTTVGIIDRLEKKGFVKRTRDVVDRRLVFIEITDQGREFILKTPHLLHNKLHGNLRTLIEREKIQIANSLDLLLLLMSKKSKKS